MPCKERLEQYFTEQHVPFDVQHHPVAYTAQQLAAAEHISGRMVAKSVIVAVGDRMVMLVLPAVHHVDLARVATITGESNVRLVEEQEFVAIFPDCEAGAMPPFGNLYQLPVYVDHTLARNETIVFPAGTHTDTISLRYADYERLVSPTLADFRTPAHV